MSHHHHHHHHPVYTSWTCSLQSLPPPRVFTLFSLCDSHSSFLRTCSLLQVYEQLRAIWRGVAQAAEPFMRHQASSLHFEFFGLDLIADQSGRCWLIEANRCDDLGVRVLAVHLSDFAAVVCCGLCGGAELLILCG